MGSGGRPRRGRSFIRRKFEEEGFERGEGSGVIYYHRGRDVSCVCHGDDFTLVGEEWELKRMAKVMEKWFEIKVRGILGPEIRDDKMIVILGRTVRWTEEGIEYEADKKHRKAMMEYFGFEEGVKGASVNGDKDRKEEEDDEEEMERVEEKKFRGMAARLNYLAQDSPDLQYPAKEISREMAKPKRGAWRRLKKVVRYLAGRRAVVWKYGYQEEVQEVVVRADSDWGGNRWSRKSTSGGVVMLGGTA